MNDKQTSVKQKYAKAQAIKATIRAALTFFI